MSGQRHSIMGPPKHRVESYILDLCLGYCFRVPEKLLGLLALYSNSEGNSGPLVLQLSYRGTYEKRPLKIFRSDKIRYG